nr:Ty3/gypsy retrotransposon protein [Tanacetum cinerariifolium]
MARPKLSITVWNVFEMFCFYLAEFWYNTSFHSAIEMSPFRALYGREPPSLPQYTLGSSQVASIDATLVEHQRVITLLKNTLAKTRQRMTDKANKHRIDKDFQEGDLVYLRLRIYRQSSVAKRDFQNLSRRYFGPFKVLEKIGQVAYRLELPPGSRIHPIFHVSLLRPSIGNSNPSTLPLPEKFIDNLPVLTPEEVLDHRTINNQVQAEQQVLIKWKDRNITEATWEDTNEILSTMPDLEDKYPEMSKEVFQAKGNLMKYIQTFLEKFNCIPFGEKPKVLLQAWEKFFAIQHAQPEDTNELFQKLLEDLKIINKELAEYINSPSWNRPTFFNDNEDHSIQFKEYLENSSNEIAASNFNQEKEGPPQDSDIHQLVREEYGIEVCEEQKQNMEDTLLELLEKEQEVKNIVEKPTKRETRIAKSLQNFRVKKSSTSLNNTSQISPVHAIAPILPTEEPEYSLSMGYEHLSTIPKMESDEVIKSSVKNLLPIPSEYEVTFDDESEYDVPIKDESSPIFTTFSNLIFDDIDDFTYSDDESFSNEDVPMEYFKVYSNFLFDDEEINSNKIDPHSFSAESDFVESLSNHDTLFDSSPKFNYLEEFSGELMPTSILNEECIRREHKEYISLMEKLFTINSIPRPLENFHDNTIVETLPTSPILIEDSDSQREEIDIFTGTDDLLPPGIESDDYDSERDIYFLEELISNDSVSLPENESSDFDHQDNPSFPRPPPKPPHVEVFFDVEPNSRELISAVTNNIDELNEYECFDPGGFIPTMIEVSRVRCVVPVHMSFTSFVCN